MEGLGIIVVEVVVMGGLLGVMIIVVEVVMVRVVVGVEVLVGGIEVGGRVGFEAYFL